MFLWKKHLLSLWYEFIKVRYKRFFLKKKFAARYLYMYLISVLFEAEKYIEKISFSFLIRSNSWRFISRKCLVKTLWKQTASVARIINQQDFSRLTNLLCDPTNVKDSILYGGSMDEDNL